MVMRWLENELRYSKIPGDQERADAIKSILDNRGEDIPLPYEPSLPPIYPQEPLVTERNPEGYLNLTAALLRIKPKASYHRPLRERLFAIASNPQEFDRLANNLESIVEQLTRREQKVLIARKALQGQGSLPEPAVILAERFDVSPNRILDIEKTALRKLRHASRLGKIKPFFSDF